MKVSDKVNFNDEIIPLIKKNNLQSKQVEVKGQNDFESITAIKKEINNSRVEKEDIRFAATKTLKISPNVLLKLNTLKPFMKEIEEMEKASLNNIVEMLIDSYVGNRLTTRQNEGYQAVYRQLFETLEKK